MDSTEASVKRPRGNNEDDELMDAEVGPAKPATKKKKG
jgi:hypothetical protein